MIFAFNRRDWRLKIFIQKAYVSISSRPSRIIIHLKRIVFSKEITKAIERFEICHHLQNLITIANFIFLKNSSFNSYFVFRERVDDSCFDVLYDENNYLINSVNNHILVSKIKLCMFKYKQLYCEMSLIEWMNEIEWRIMKSVERWSVCVTVNAREM